MKIERGMGQIRNARFFMAVAVPKFGTLSNSRGSASRYLFHLFIQVHIRLDSPTL
jgi:hypothetical protein